ncbi:hypothetical protein E4O93_03990 [Diaphorobacter sp. DS2]|nr:hypothetical protein E4O93_03990 [Diaphorobacter sp. DS2]
MSFSAFLRTRWAALRLVWARVLQRPEKLLSLHSLLWALMAAGLVLLQYVLVLIPFTPGIRDIRKAKTEQPAQLVASDGKLLAEYRWVNRAWVPLSEIAPPVVDALIATEDHRFYKHWGLDWRRTASALVRTLGGDKQGGSTITSQGLECRLRYLFSGALHSLVVYQPSFFLQQHVIPRSAQFLLK